MGSADLVSVSYFHVESAESCSVSANLGLAGRNCEGNLRQMSRWLLFTRFLFRGYVLEGKVNEPANTQPLRRMIRSEVNETPNANPRWKIFSRIQ